MASKNENTIATGKCKNYAPRSLSAKLSVILTATDTEKPAQRPTLTVVGMFGPRPNDPEVRKLLREAERKRSPTWVRALEWKCDRPFVDQLVLIQKTWRNS